MSNKYKFLTAVLQFIAVISLLSSSAVTLYPQASISYNGEKYEVEGNTILLDREGIFGCQRALTDPNEAFECINRIGKNAVLLVAPSVYWLDDPDDPELRTDKGGTPFAVHLKCDTLSIIGLSDNPEDVVFAVNRGQTQGADGNFTMFQFSGRSLETKNITFGNYCNTDLVYPRNKELNRLKRKDAIVQAQIGICDGTDRLFAENCRFISRLNLCPFVGARRSLYDNCYFECTDDALSGSAIYLDCRFTFFSSKPFYSTAETGAVFLNCDITCLGSGVQYFTKVPGQVTAIDTRFHSNNPIDIKWTRDKSDIICLQENISLNGKPYIIDADRTMLWHALDSDSIRNAYVLDFEGKKLYNLPNLLNDADGWDPKNMNALIGRIANAKGKALTGLPVAMRVKRIGNNLIKDGDTVSFQFTPLLWGGTTAGKDFLMSGFARNDKPEPKTTYLITRPINGVTSHASFTVAPNLRKAPKFKRKPKISYDEEGGYFRVNYTLSDKGSDESEIIWGRVSSGDESPEILMVKQASAPDGLTYTAKAGDFAGGIVAAVLPKYHDSATGILEVSHVIEIFDPARISDIPESALSTDFHDIPIVERQPGVPGIWSFDVFKPADTSHIDWVAAEGPGWYYGKGFDASSGTGIIQNEKGARMSYVPARDVCKNMSVSLIAEPAKSGGQGFGSATSQYMDICVKFDPVNLDGYALRIERTPDHDRAVRFSLIRYDKGKTSVISKEVISDCYRTPCYITLGITDGVLNASAYTQAQKADRKCCDEVVEQVQLSVPVESSSLTGFCIQHTGSTGPSSTLIRDLNINWD